MDGRPARLGVRDAGRIDPNFSQTVNCYTNHTAWTPYGRTSKLRQRAGPVSVFSHVALGLRNDVLLAGARPRRSGVLGLWSNPDRFIRNPLTPILSPATDLATAVAVPTLTWSAVGGAESTA